MELSARGWIAGVFGMPFSSLPALLRDGEERPGWH